MNWLARWQPIARWRAIATSGVIALAIVIGAAPPAAAEPHKVLVMQSEGRADPKLRVRIDATLVRLAKATGDQVSAGDITFEDAAAAVGCKPDDAACKDEVIGMLTVDEIVITTVTPKPGGLEIAVRRVGKGGASRDAMSLVAPDKIDTLEAIAPLFTAKPAASVLAPARPASPPPPAAPPPVVGPTRPTAPIVGPPAPAPAATATTPPSTTPAGPQPPAITTAPTPATAVDVTSPTAVREPGPSVIATSHPRRETPPRRRLQKVGMTAGATMLVAGLVFWGSALGVQREIDAAPVGTKGELHKLQDLEARGDRHAAIGNVLVISGLVLGTASTYYFFKKGRSARTDRSGRSSPAAPPERPPYRSAGTAPAARSNAWTTARIEPAVFDHGAGLALVIGGSP